MSKAKSSTLTERESHEITHEGVLKFGADLEIPCFVLKDGTRVLSGRGLQESLKIRERHEGGKRGGYILPKFLESNALKPFIDSKLEVANLTPLNCYKGNLLIHGFEATILADICDALLDARKAKVKLTDRQQIVVEQAEILIRSLAKVGIIALVDEATGYQYEREKDELQTILKAYIAVELLPWQKRFPDEFYKEIFRLNKWDYTVNGIKQRPGVIGTWTKKLIYQQLPKGVLQELYHKTPKTTTGKLAAKLHQSLTSEIGNPHLEKQLVSVITLMNISKDWKEFLKFFNKKFGQQEIEFEEVEPIMPLPLNKFDLALTGLLRTPPPKKDKK